MKSDANQAQPNQVILVIIKSLAIFHPPERERKKKQNKTTPKDVHTTRIE